MAEDLVARLRKIAGHELDHMAAEAADELERLREAIQWVVRDASYKAPEQMGPAMAARWIGRLRSALEGTADETKDG